jgi:hypothetical protein
MTLIIAYPHSDAACLLNGVASPLCLPNIMPAKNIEVLLAPPCSIPVLAILSATFRTAKRETSAQSQLPGKHHRHKITSQGCHMFDCFDEAQSLSPKFYKVDMEVDWKSKSYIT